MLAVGARPIAPDRSPEMLAWQRTTPPPAAVGDVGRLPVRSQAVDDVFAAFVLNHLLDPAAGLAELAWVTRPGGALLASVHSNASRSAARDRVDAVAAAHGFIVPNWCTAMKAAATPLLGSVPRMTHAAAAAGWTVHEVHELAVDVGVRTATDLVEYRLGQAHYARWLAGLTRPAGARSDAPVEAVAPIMTPYRPVVVFLVATRPRAGA